MVFTNGTIRIDKSIRCPLVISVWGDEETTAEFRGGGVFWKSIRTCASDDRARILFTVHARNIHQIPAVTQIVADHGLLLSFNYFSPTESYLQKLSSHAPNDDKFFRTSSEDDNFTLTPDALLRARDAIDKPIDLHPRTVFHSTPSTGWRRRPKGSTRSIRRPASPSTATRATAAGTRRTAST